MFYLHFVMFKIDSVGNSKYIRKFNLFESSSFIKSEIFIPGKERDKFNYELS